MKKQYDLKKLKRRDGPSKVWPGAAKTAISIRVDGSALAKIRDEAERLGIPYQTLIGSILHRYTSGQFTDRSALESGKRLKRAS